MNVETIFLLIKTKMWGISILTISSILYVSVGLAPLVYGENRYDGRIGKPFTDPSYRFPLPDRWRKRSIEYGTEVARSDLVVTLDQHLFPALLPLINRFATRNKLNISVKEGTCGISAGLLKRKVVDMGGFCCTPGRADRLPGLKYHTLGIAALAVLVHAQNKIDNITLDQTRDIFSGKLHYWNEISGLNGSFAWDSPIQVVGRLHCKARAGHWRLLLDNEDHFSTNMVEVGSIPDMIALVGGNKLAIGFEVMWMTRLNRSLGSVKPLTIDGHSPLSEEDLVAHNYPFYRVYNITTWEDSHIRKKEADELAEFLISEIDQVDRKFGFLSAEKLRKAGWRFKENELIGEP